MRLCRSTANTPPAYAASTSVRTATYQSVSSREAGDRPPSAQHLIGTPAAQECPHAREQLGERERLDQIVVGTGVESVNAILDGVARRQHQHWCLEAALSHRREDLKPVAAREHQVEDHQVEALRGYPEEAILPRRRQRDLVVRRLEPFLQRPGALFLLP